MKLSYGIPELNEASQKLARKLLGVILESGVTFQEADDALEGAQRLLLSDTKPTQI